MTRVFELSWSWHEEYQPYLFFGPGKTQSMFEEDVNAALRAVGEAFLISKEDRWVGADLWIGMAANHLETMGYQRINPVQVDIFGAYIIDGKPHKSDEEAEFGERIGPELLEKALLHNKAVREKMYKT